MRPCETGSPQHGNRCCWSHLDRDQDGIASDGGLSWWMRLEAEASNLVPGDTNSTWDVFVRDRAGHRWGPLTAYFCGTVGNVGVRQGP
jgi:hypothetical protein